MFLFCLAYVCLLPTRAEGLLFPVTEKYLIDTWRLNAVLPDGATTDIVQTPDGYLWIGSFQGVLRFDGKRFVKFTPENKKELPSLWVLCLFVDREGVLWMGTGSGLVRIKDGIWEDLHALPGWKGKAVKNMAQNSQGKMFLSTDDCIYCYQNDRFDEIAIPPVSKHASIAFDPQDQLWLGTDDTLFVQESGVWKKVYTIPSTNRRMSRISKARNGGFWVPDGEEIRCWKEGQWLKNFKIPNGFTQDASKVCEDRQGGLWVAFYSHGLLHYFPDGSIAYATTREGLLNDSTRDVFEDNEGNIWASSNGGGLARLKPRRLQVYGQETGLKQGVVNSVVELSTNRMLVATHGGGLVPFDGKQFDEPWTTPDDHLSQRGWILSGIKRSNGSLLFMVYNHGLVQFQPRLDGFGYSGTVAAPEVDCLFEDHQNQVWVGTIKGLATLEESKLVLLTNQLPAGRIGAITEDTAGRLWVNVSGKGIYRANKTGSPASFALFLDGQQPQPVSLFGDKTGSVWIGYRSGRLDRIQGERSTQYGAEHGLPDAGFSSLNEDVDGNLWAGTDIGILRITRASLDAVQSGQTNRLNCGKYDQSDGLVAVHCRNGFQPLSGRFADGRLWFASLQGFAVVDPQQIFPRKVPIPWIEEITLDSRPKVLNPGFDKTLVVPAGTRRVGITFTGISLESADRVAFQYQLQPSDSDWLSVGQDRSVQFRDMHPGNYVFQCACRQRLRQLVAASHSGDHRSTLSLADYSIQDYRWCLPAGSLCPACRHPG